MEQEIIYDKQIIEEMAKAMCGNCKPNGNCATDDEPCFLECVYGWCAEKLYIKGYRKQSEGKWYRSGQDGSECSLCGAENTNLRSKNNFCPNCGAKMKGEGQG